MSIVSQCFKFVNSFNLFVEYINVHLADVTHGDLVRCGMWQCYEHAVGTKWFGVTYSYVC